MNQPVTESDILLREYDNAWTQNRHLETLRSQYVGFFLTFLAACVALGGSRASQAFHSAPKATEMALLLASLSVVTWFVSVSLRRWGVVIRHYDVVILEIRARCVPREVFELLRIQPRKGLGIQQAAELTLLATHLALVASVSLALARVWTLDGSARYLVPATVAEIIVVVGAVTGANWRVLRGAYISVTGPTHVSMPKGG